MPYIKPEERKDVITPIDAVLLNRINQYDYVVDVRGKSFGSLNYLISFLCHKHLKYHGCSYAVINSVIGVLECAKLELYRMIAAPYENKKRMENGSVSNLDAPNMQDVR